MNVLPQDSLKSIANNYSMSDGNLLNLLTSKKKIDNGTLKVNYKIEEFERGKNDVLKLKGIDSFYVNYKFVKNEWFCNDGKLENLEY